MKPLHFRQAWLDTNAVCGKSTSRVQSVSRISNWDDLAINGGRRCPDCAKVVEVMRREAEEGQ